MLLFVMNKPIIVCFSPLGKYIIICILNSHYLHESSGHLDPVSHSIGGVIITQLAHGFLYRVPTALLRIMSVQDYKLIRFFRKYQLISIILYTPAVRNNSLKGKLKLLIHYLTSYYECYRP